MNYACNQKTDRRSYRNNSNRCRSSHRRVYRRKGEIGSRFVPHIGRLKTLSQPVNEQEVLPAAYKSEDLADLKSQTESRLATSCFMKKARAMRDIPLILRRLRLRVRRQNPLFCPNNRRARLPKSFSISRRAEN